MEFIVCMLLASILTGGRIGVDLLSAAKGTPAPHVEKARIRAEQERQRLAAKTARREARNRPRPADGKPRLRDVAAVYWGDAMADAIDAHNRRRTEKQAQRLENERAGASGEAPAQVRPSLKERIARVGRLLWEPVGENRNDPTTEQDEKGNHTDVCGKCGQAVRPNDELCDRCGNEDPIRPGPPLVHPSIAEEMFGIDINNDPKGHLTGRPYPLSQQENPMTQINGAEADRNRELWRQSEQTSASHQRAAAVAAPTGEAVNYETTVAELEALIDRLRTHLESTIAAVASIRQAKVAISDSQQTYNPAAAAAGSISEHLPALNVDAETVGHTGTVANAMPPNAVDNMFDQLEAMEVTAVEQQSNAEAALGSAEQALKVVQEKYGDANTTVQGELAGDSRFLAGSGVAA